MHFHGFTKPLSAHQLVNLKYNLNLGKVVIVGVDNRIGLIHVNKLWMVQHQGYIA
jgi:hypothetical protein